MPTRRCGPRCRRRRAGTGCRTVPSLRWCGSFMPRSGRRREGRRVRVRDAADGKPAEALGRGLELAMIYPKAIRSRILPVVVEAAVRAGGSPFGDERLAKSARLGFARALEAERDGKVEEALAGYDALD